MLNIKVEKGTSIQGPQGHMSIKGQEHKPITISIKCDWGLSNLQALMVRCHNRGIAKANKAKFPNGMSA